VRNEVALAGGVRGMVNHNNPLQNCVHGRTGVFGKKAWWKGGRGREGARCGQAKKVNQIRMLQVQITKKGVNGI